MSSSHRGNCIPQSESDLLGAGRSAQDHPVHQGILRPPLLPVNHPRTKTRSVDNMAGEQVPDKDGLSGSFPYMEVRTCETSAAGQENPGGTGSTLGRNLFGQPKTRRRKTVPVKLVGRVPPDISIAFPFSPLVTKTRDYAKLDSAAKVQRLQRSGHALETIKRPSTVQGEGPRTKRLHQQRMEEFVYRDPPTSKGKAPPHSLPKAKGSYISNWLQYTVVLVTIASFPGFTRTLVLRPIRKCTESESLSDWSEYERTGKAWERGYSNQDTLK